MRTTQPAHARLQIAITEWMKTEIPEAAALFNRDDDHYGVLVGNHAIEESYVAMRATNAAYAVVIQALETLGLDQD